jgi:hypothetical protein
MQDKPRSPAADDIDAGEVQSPHNAADLSFARRGGMGHVTGLLEESTWPSHPADPIER